MALLSMPGVLFPTVKLPAPPPPKWPYKSVSEGGWVRVRVSLC